MHFTHEGKKYKIEFQHGKRKDWRAHYGHPVYLAAGDDDSNPVLRCQKCDMTIAQASDWYTEHPRYAFAFGDKERARNVHCRILRQVGGTTEWEVWTRGTSRLNVDAGDRYAREPGRVAALTDALHGYAREFRTAAWAAYNGRKQPHPRNQSKGAAAPKHEA